MLKPPLLRFLTKLHRQYGLTGPLLTLGVQDVPLTYEDAEKLLHSIGAPIHPVPPPERESTTAIWTQGKAQQAPLIHARTYFRMLGIRDYYDVDASPAERPGWIADLNQPVPESWHRRFNWILDSGTLEHIFDMKTALSNLVRMATVGGYVMHASPTSGWLNHGFYQISPCLLYDFYQANGFRPLTSFLAFQRADGGLAFSAYRYTPERVSLAGNSEQVLLIFLARKVAEVPRIVNPVQRKYAARMPQARAG